MVYYNPLSANVQLTNHLGFEPGVQGAEHSWKMALEIDLFS